MAITHSTKCLRDSCQIMGVDLWSSDRFVMDAIYWLTQKGRLEIEQCRNEDGTPDGDWIIHLETLDGGKICGGDNSLSAALCGIIQCFGDI